MASGLSSTGFAENYDRAVRTTLESADIVGGENPNTVNILGYGIHDLGWTYGRDEFRALLTAMGVRGNGSSAAGLEGRRSWTPVLPH